MVSRVGRRGCRTAGWIVEGVGQPVGPLGGQDLAGEAPLIGQRQGDPGTWLPVGVDRHLVQVVQGDAGGGERVPDAFWFRAGDGVELLAGKWRHGDLLGRWRGAGRRCRRPRRSAASWQGGQVGDSRGGPPAGSVRIAYEHDGQQLRRPPRRVSGQHGRASPGRPARRASWPDFVPGSGAGEAPIMHGCFLRPVLMILDRGHRRRWPPIQDHRWGWRLVPGHGSYAGCHVTRSNSLPSGSANVVWRTAATPGGSAAGGSLIWCSGLAPRSVSRSISSSWWSVTRTGWTLLLAVPGPGGWWRIIRGPASGPVASTAVSPATAPGLTGRPRALPQKSARAAGSAESMVRAAKLRLTVVVMMVFLPVG